MFLIKGSYIMGFADVLDYVNLVFDAMAFWLIWRARKATTNRERGSVARVRARAMNAIAAAVVVCFVALCIVSFS